MLREAACRGGFRGLGAIRGRRMWTIWRRRISKWFLGEVLEECWLTR